MEIAGAFLGHRPPERQHNIFTLVRRLFTPVIGLQTGPSAVTKDPESLLGGIGAAVKNRGENQKSQTKLADRAKGGPTTP